MTNATETLNDAAVVMTVTFHKPGVTKRVQSGEVQVRARGVEEAQARDPKSEAVKVTKTLLDSAEYRAISALDSYIRGYLRSQALPTRLADGRYLMPLRLIDTISAKVDELIRQREGLVDVFMAVYPDRIAERAQVLGDFFKVSDYLAPDAMRADFSVEVSIAALEMPGAGLAKFSAALYEREVRKAHAAREQMVGEIRDGLRVAMADLVAALVDMLTPREDGTQPKVLGCHIEGLKSFINDFAARNLADDKSLADLVERAKSLVSNVGLNDLRRSTDVRASIAAGLEGIKARLDQVISSDASTLRASFVELNDSAPSAPLPATEATERASRLDDQGAPAELPNVAAEGVRSVDLEEVASSCPDAAEVAHVTARAARLDLE